MRRYLYECVHIYTHIRAAYVYVCLDMAVYTHTHTLLRAGIGISFLMRASTHTEKVTIKAILSHLSPCSTQMLIKYHLFLKIFKLATSVDSFSWKLVFFLNGIGIYVMVADQLVDCFWVQIQDVVDDL